MLPVGVGTTLILLTLVHTTLEAQVIKQPGNYEVSYKQLPLKKIEVKANKNIELFGLMMQLDMGQDLLNSIDSVLIESKKVTWRDWYSQSLKITYATGDLLAAS